MRRYVEGQRLYLDSCVPRERAHVVLDNSDPLDPVVLVQRQGAGSGSG
jgi:uridine kinase